MAAIMEYVVVPASVVLVIGLAFWSHRTHGEVLALRKGSAVYPAVAIAIVVAILAQLAVPMEHKDISQPLLSVAIAWAFGALVIAGLLRPRDEPQPTEPRA